MTGFSEKPTAWSGPFARAYTALSASTRQVGADAGSIPDDAPSDGQWYARQNGAWAPCVGSVNGRFGAVTLTHADITDLTHADITDWAAALAPYALLVSPSFTGAPLTPTAVPGTNNTQIASTAFVTAAIVAATTGVASFNGRTGAVTLSNADVTSVLPPSSTSPVMDGTAAVGTGSTWARADHVHPSDTSRLALAGGTMTGELILASDPANPLDAATKQYVDAEVTAAVAGVVITNPNRLINGDMRINQRGATSGTTGAYTVDRWQYFATEAGKLQWQQIPSSTTDLPVTGEPYYLKFVSLSAYAVGVNDFFQLSQAIEADQIADVAYSTSSPKSITLSFWVLVNTSGNYSASIQSYSQSRCYTFTYSVPVINTWTKIAVTIPGDTFAGWVMNGSTGAMYVMFDLGSGTNQRTGTTNNWLGGSPFYGANGSVNLVTISGGTFQITAVKLEVGSTATPFNQDSLSRRISDCQRYYQRITDAGGGCIALGMYTSSASFAVANTMSIPPMRATPTVTAVGTFTTTNVGSVALISTPNSLTISIAAGAAGNVVWQSHPGAYLDFGGCEL